MPKFYSLEKPSSEKREFLEKTISEQPGAKPRLIFMFPINKSRESALEMIKTNNIDENEAIELLQSDDFIERYSGLYLLDKISSYSEDSNKKISLILENMKTIETIMDLDINRLIARIRIKININSENETENLRNIEKMSNGSNPYIRREIIPELAKDVKKNLCILEKLSLDKDRYVRQKIAEEIICFGKDTPQIIKNLLEDNDWFIRRELALQSNGLDDKVFDVANKLANDENEYVRQAVIKSEVDSVIDNNNKKESLEILEEMSSDMDSDVREVADQETRKLNKKEGNMWLLSSKKPLFSTFETKELIDKINKLEIIMEEVSMIYKDNFVGVVLYGSTAKGYSQKESDIECKVIGKTEEVHNCFNELAKELKLKLCEFENHYIDIDEHDKIKSHHENLFCGLFLGDYKKLKQMQKKFIEDTNETDWDEIRKEIRRHEIELYKAVPRLNIENEELEKIKQYASILRVPPTYSEMKKLLRINNES